MQHAPPTPVCTYSTAFISNARVASLQPEKQIVRTISSRVVRCRCVPEESAVRTGKTQFGRGLLSTDTLPAKKKLLSVPFEQLLLLTESHGGSFDSSYCKFAAAHAYIPDNLKKFIQGNIFMT